MTRDPDEIREAFSDPDAAGLGYLIGRECFTGQDELGRTAVYDLAVIDIDDGRRGLAQLHMLTREIQSVWAERPDRENAALVSSDDFKNGVPIALPRTMTIRTPSGNEQRIYRLPSGDADAIIGVRLDTSLELKAASREGAPISGRLPPTFRPGTGQKPGGQYQWKERMLPAVLPWPWEEHFLNLAQGIRERHEAVSDSAPPKRVGQYEIDQALRRLRAVCTNIAKARIGRRTEINDGALNVGHLAWAFPKEELAIRELIKAAGKSHWPGDIEKTVREAFADGANDPRDVRRGMFSRHRKRIEDPLNFGERP